jgi:hypothetical protein
MMVPFRYGCGALAKYAANKEACLQNLPGFQRHKGEIIYGQNWLDETAGRAIVLSSPKIYLILTRYGD